MEFLDKSIALLEEINAAPEKRQWCKENSVYSENPGQAELHRRINTFEGESYANGLVITNYAQVLQRYGLCEPFTKIDQMPYLAALACTAWHFRRDHFSEGSLISESIASGDMLRLLRRLRETQPGDSFATTLDTLFRFQHETLIPNQPGIYRVLAPVGFKI